MLRSLYSGVSGLKNNQTSLDVISNNIANSSTTAFKSSRVLFSDVLNQTIGGASAPITSGIGGVNPKQVGIGVKVSSIDASTNQGSPETTDSPYDCLIDGEGYFIISNDGTNKLYTRDGSFRLDPNSNLVTANGYHIMGLVPTSADITGGSTMGTTLSELKIPQNEKDLTVPSGLSSSTATLDNFSIGKDGKITGVYSNGDKIVLGQIGLAKFANPGGLTRLESNTYTVSANSGTAVEGAAGANSTGEIIQNALEASNVDLASEFTNMITASRSYQANAKSITTSDEMLQTLIELKR